MRDRRGLATRFRTGAENIHLIEHALPMRGMFRALYLADGVKQRVMIGDTAPAEVVDAAEACRADLMARSADVRMINRLTPRAGAYGLSTAHVRDYLDRFGHEYSIMALPVFDVRTSTFLDVESLSSAARAEGVRVAWDLTDGFEALVDGMPSTVDIAFWREHASPGSGAMISAGYWLSAGIDPQAILAGQSRPIEPPIPARRSAHQDVRVTVVAVEREEADAHVGDYFDVRNGSKLHIPPGGGFSTTAMGAVLPVLREKQSATDSSSWINRKPFLAGPDARDGVVVRLDFIEKGQTS